MGFSTTQYLVLASLIYYTIKSRGVRRDALDRSSPRFEIMKLVIDRFYTHDTSEMATTTLRMLLQGADTYVHFSIVRDLAASHSKSTDAWEWFLSSMHVLFGVWVAHTALNQLLQRSTASAVVEAWDALARRGTHSEPLIIWEENEVRDG
ncbi:hypothetical protein ACHAWF_005829 [Thalassiosira exigua]